MRRWLMLWTLTCGLAGPISAAEAVLTPDQERIQELEQRIRELESELARLRKPVPAVAPRPVYPRDLRPPGVPNDAVEREFNGAKYYLIPLNSRKSAGQGIPSA